MGKLDKIKKTLEDKHKIRNMNNIRGGKKGRNGGSCTNPVPQ